MKYIPLDSIGKNIYNEDGTLSTLVPNPGDNYPADLLGIPKSELVTRKEKNIILEGIYKENTVKYPLLNPVDAAVKSIPSTTFGFLVKDIATQQLYASERVYDDLIKAYEENNPWYTIYTIPTINVDIQYLSQYNKANKFQITEAYTNVEITSTLEIEEDILRYIDWLVKPAIDVTNIELKEIEEIGNWNLVDDPQIGLGYKEIYDSMLKDKDPDPEAIGDEPINAVYDLSLPPVTQVSPEFQSVPEEQIVPKLADAIISIPKPRSQEMFHPLGSGAAKWILGAAAVAVTIASLGSAIPFLSAAAATAVAGVAGTVSIYAGVAGGVTGLLQSISAKAPGSYVEFILARTTTRGAGEAKKKVFERERKSDEDDWNALLSAAKSKMGVTRYTNEHVKAALTLVLAAFENTNAKNLSYSMRVGWWGKTDGTFTLSVVNPSQIKLNLKIS